MAPVVLLEKDPQQELQENQAREFSRNRRIVRTRHVIINLLTLAVIGVGLLIVIWRTVNAH